MTRRRRPARERRLLLRSRIALTTALVVALAISGVSVITWLVTEHNLRTQLDNTLTRAPIPPAPGAADGTPPFPDLETMCRKTAAGKPLQRFVEGLQFLRRDGSTCVPDGVDPVLTDAADLTVTAPTLRDGVTAGGIAVRAMVRPFGSDAMLITSRSVADIDNALAGLRAALLAVSLIGVAVAGTAGLLLTRQALRPMERLTNTAEHIARTQDLETPVDVSGRDEAGRLGRAFAAMTDALTESRRRQRDLVTDAAHELRTPLTSLRTNIDLLARSENARRPLPEAHRRQLIASLQSQSKEFTELVTELVILAKDQRTLDRLPVRIHTVIERAVRRAASRSTRHHIDVEAAEWSTVGDAGALERCVVNLLDNAIKFAPAGSTIAVESEPGWISVTDEGPGIPADDRKHVFDRFWRAPEARAMPGSGLGLAIVADTIAAHGGTVTIDSPVGTGTHIHIELPVKETGAPEESPHRPAGAS
ncbi:ATP-binding protein [Amycolatopsis sp. lyj-346]|uniref:HAMP domain-containing sensor histidine kinase n=1 Tax=Amycolatopsis sp. lyj-346 TaxID=2789289 RepID=UPI00397E75E9